MSSRRSSRRRRMLLHGQRADGPDEPDDGDLLDDSAVLAESPSSLVRPSTDAAGPFDESPPGFPLAISTDGPHEPIELVLRPPHGCAESLRVDEPLFFVGRGESCDLRLDDAAVSTRHALLQRVGGRVLFLDLGSRTGTFRNGRRADYGWLGPGDELRLGPFALGRTGDADDGPAPPPDRLFSRLPADGPRPFGLRILGADERRPMLPLERPITLVGRASICKLRLDHESVSRVHASLMLSAEGVSAVDLRGRGGLLVNGRPVTRATLRPGDELGIGRYRLQVTRLDAAASPLPSDSLALALVDEVIELHREFHELTRRQTDLLLRLVESVGPGRHDEVAAELARLQELAETTLAARRERLLSAVTRGRPSDATERLRRHDAKIEPGRDRLPRLTD